MTLQNKLGVSSLMWAMVASAGLLHCGPGGSADGGDVVVVDSPTANPDARDGAAATSRAGLECMDESMCGGSLTCDTMLVAGGVCTGTCNNGTPAMEAQQCGGAGSTCLTAGDPPDSVSECTKSCRARVMASGCRAGFICTGFWGTHMGGVPDSPGCSPFCTADAQCTGGQRCNVRTGECGAAGSNMALIADGEPCRIPAQNQPSPCRGICFPVVNGNPTGVCGSIIDLSKTQECPDSPMTIPPLGVDGDNLAYCNFHSCSANECCRGGLVCEGQDGNGLCVVDDPMTPNIDCTASGDAGADGGADASADSGADASDG